MSRLTNHNHHEPPNPITSASRIHHIQTNQCSPPETHPPMTFLLNTCKAINIFQPQGASTSHCHFLWQDQQMNTPQIQCGQSLICPLCKAISHTFIQSWKHIVINFTPTHSNPCPFNQEQSCIQVYHSIPHWILNNE